MYVCVQMGRDVFNEKPSTEELLAADAAGVGASSLPRAAVMHTTKVSRPSYSTHLPAALALYKSSLLHSKAEPGWSWS
jgi:hypothetical protein